jgi:hypothetical protein
MQVKWRVHLPALTIILSPPYNDANLKVFRQRLHYLGSISRR